MHATILNTGAGDLIQNAALQIGDDFGNKSAPSHLGELFRLKAPSRASSGSTKLAKS